MGNILVSRDAARAEWNGYISQSGIWDLKIGGGGFLRFDADGMMLPVRPGVLGVEDEIIEISYLLPGGIRDPRKPKKPFFGQPPVVGLKAAADQAREILKNGQDFDAVQFVFEDSYYDARNAIQFAQNIKVPLILYQGEQDSAIPAANSRVFLARASELGKVVPHFVPSDDGHEIGKYSNYQHWLSLTRGFLGK